MISVFKAVCDAHLLQQASSRSTIVMHKFKHTSTPSRETDTDPTSTCTHHHHHL
jgi:hypothetical protein